MIISMITDYIDFSLCYLNSLPSQFLPMSMNAKFLKIAKII